MEQLSYGTQAIHFYFKKSDRKTLGIEVHPDLSVWAIAPLKATLPEVKKVIEKRASWIVKQQRYFEQFLPRTPEREYVSGETHFYLGRRYILRIRKSTQNEVKLIAGELIVYYSKDKSSGNIKHLLTDWYYHHANRKFNQELKKAIDKFGKYGLTLPPLEIRRMKNRWGSCTPKGKIILNPEIIKTPSHCIEYVIIHELCHLIHANHSKAFYELQSSVMPGWEQWKDKLERIIV